MKKIKTILSTLLIIFISISTIAQNNRISEEEVWLDQLVKEYSYNVVLQTNDLHNRAFIMQEGSGNNAIVNQVLTERHDQNIANVLQQGSYNSVFVNQFGAGLENNAYQYGKHNHMDLESRGKAVKSTIFQIGDENKIKQRLNGRDMNYVILQEGIRNELIHRENGVSMPEYRIEQRGVGMKVIIEHSNIYRK